MTEISFSSKVELEMYDTPNDPNIKDDKYRAYHVQHVSAGMQQ